MCALFCSRLKPQGMLSFHSGNYAQALDFLVKAVQTNAVASGITLRMAIAVCCFKLEQFERAKFALDKCFSIDVSSNEAQRSL